MAELYDYLKDKYHPDDIKQINERLVELSSLFEISQILNSTLNLDEILNQILLIPMGRLLISRGAVLLRSGDSFQVAKGKGVPAKIQETQFSVGEISPETVHISSDSQWADNASGFREFLTRAGFFIAVPLKTTEELIGVVLFGRKLNGKDFTTEEIDFLNSLCNIATTAIANALKVEEISRINQQLDQRIQQLKTLFDINQGLSATLDEDKIRKLFIYAVMGQMLVNHYALLLFRNGSGRVADAKGINGEIVEKLLPDLAALTDINTAIPIELLANKALRQRLENLKVRVLIPLKQQNNLMGVVLLGEKISRQAYTQIDLEFLTTLASQATVSLENAHLFKESLEKQRIEKELQVAKTIQKMLLPHQIPEVERYDVWGINISSKEVGGDYFDIIKISETKVALAIGDVSGKSVPAALLMANLQAGLRSLIDENIDLPYLVARLNNLIYQNTDLDKYITFFLGILDIGKNEFEYVNAGHNPPVVIGNDRQMKMLDKGGIILGMLPTVQYEKGAVSLKPGDLFFSYTDGVNEALSTGDEEFGEDRMYRFLRKHRDKGAREIAQKLVEEIEQFTTGAEQFDDITMLILKRMK